MAKELVAREFFGLDGKLYQIGDHITDAAEMERVLAERSQFVRAIERADEPTEPEAGKDADAAAEKAQASGAPAVSSAAADLAATLAASKARSAAVAAEDTAAAKEG